MNHLMNLVTRYHQSEGAQVTKVEEPPLGSLAAPADPEESVSHHLHHLLDLSLILRTYISHEKSNEIIKNQFFKKSSEIILHHLEIVYDISNDSTIIPKCTWIDLQNIDCFHPKIHGQAQFLRSLRLWNQNHYKNLPMWSLDIPLMEI